MWAAETSAAAVSCWLGVQNSRNTSVVERRMVNVHTVPLLFRSRIGPDLAKNSRPEPAPVC